MFNPCEKCKHKPGPKPGYYYTNKGIIECDCHKQYVKNVQLNSYFKKVNIFLPYVFNEDLYKNEDKKTLQYIKRLLEKNWKKDPLPVKGFFIYGNTATKKTTLAKWIGQELKKNYNFSVYYLTGYDLCKRILIPLHVSPEIRNIFEKIQSTDLLIVDDIFNVNAFSKNAFDHYVQQHIIPFILARDSLNFYTILISPHSIKNSPIPEDFKIHLKNYYIEIELKEPVVQSISLKDLFPD